MRQRGWELSKITLLDLDFFRGLYDGGLIDDKALTELASNSLRTIPKEAQSVLCPMTVEVINIVVDHYRAGRKKIAIYRDSKGQRYVAADPE